MLNRVHNKRIIYYNLCKIYCLTVPTYYILQKMMTIFNYLPSITINYIDMINILPTKQNKY